MLKDGCLHGDQGFWCDRMQIVALMNLKIVCNTYVQICTYAYIIYKYVRILSRRTYVNTKGFELKEQMAQADDVGEWETE